MKNYKTRTGLKLLFGFKNSCNFFLLLQGWLQGCLQFFTGIGGQVTSFNFLEGVNPIMIRNLLYSVCIRAEKGKDDPVILMKYL